MLHSLNQGKSEFAATNLVPNESNEGQPNESQSKIFKLPTEEIVEFKGKRYKIHHEYQDSGENLIEVLKKHLLKNSKNLTIIRFCVTMMKLIFLVNAEPKF
jgi:hypothetical protein